ncbi:FeoB-associated Cys-rich membrane protein [Fusibacter sp. JL298sf-3]
MGTFVIGGLFLAIFAWAFIHARRTLKSGKCAGCSSCSDSKKTKKSDTCDIKF